MNSITVRNIPTPIHKKLKERSKIKRRSLNSEIIACLEEFLLPNQLEVDKILKKSEELRTNQNFEISLDEIEETIRTGRE
ncbi:MAG: Arc family DNA-binding protein [Melioribacteraceae bacterium]|nr:Arc family DNA-binding protein [Melioribacteraceae bacterium]MCF8263466.1 Arc family DNA-binding protein [Melioribacteraceae bacterium]MCF8431262.1 Arc family DNA-binding protein [Melioribacteraceae bacterium]